MRDNPTQIDREVAVGDSKAIAEVVAKQEKKGRGYKTYTRTSRDTFKKLAAQLMEMPPSAVKKYPPDLQDWIIELRPDLKGNWRSRSP